jgi:hypothetical protein
MGLTSSLQPRLDQAQALPQGHANDQADRQVGWGEGIGAAFRSGQDQNGWHRAERLSDAYAQIAEEVAKASGKNEYDYGWFKWQDSGFGQQAWDADKMWSDIAAQRRVDPNFLKAAGANRQQFEQQVLTRGGTGRVDAATAGRAGVIANLAGGLGAGFTDPVNIVFGGGAGGAAIAFARSTARQIAAGAITRFGIEAAAQGLGNVGVEGAQLAGESTDPSRGGATPGIGEVANDLGSAFLMGGLMHTGVAGLGAGVQAAGRAVSDVLPQGPRMLRETEHLQFPPVSDAEIAQRFEVRVPEVDRTPDEVSALQVLNRSAQVEASSPYANTYAGQDLHQQRLAGATQQLLTGATAPAPILPRRVAMPITQDSIIHFVQHDLEGGSAVVNYNAADGGVTKYGIAARDNPGVDVAGLTADRAAAIAKQRYWFPELDQASPRCRRWPSTRDMPVGRNMARGCCARAAAM